MNYEKAYKDALERAKDQLDGAKVFDYDNEQIAYDIRTTVYGIFSELKESEDEKNRRIKKEVVEILHYYHSKSLCFIPPQFSLEETLAWLEKQGERNNFVEQLTAFAQHLNKRGAFRDDLCMDFEHEAQSFIEMQNNKEL